MPETITATVTCHHCQQPTPQADAQPFGLLVPSGIFEHGKELWRATNQTIYECGACWLKELECETGANSTVRSI